MDSIDSIIIIIIIIYIFVFSAVVFFLADKSEVGGEGRVYR